MTKPNPYVKAKEYLTKYKTKEQALIQLQQVYYLSNNSPYWESVIENLKTSL